MPQLLLASACLAATGLESLADAIARVEARLDAWAADTTAYNHLLLQVFAAAGTEPARWQQSTGELKHSLQSSGPAIRLELPSGEQLVGLNGAFTANAPGGGECLYLNSTCLQGANAASILETAIKRQLGKLPLSSQTLVTAAQQAGFAFLAITRPCRRLGALASPPQGRHFLVGSQMIRHHQLSAGCQRVKPS